MNEPNFGEIIVGIMIFCIVLIIVFFTIFLGRVVFDDEYFKELNCSCEMVVME